MQIKGVVTQVVLIFRVFSFLMTPFNLEGQFDDLFLNYFHLSKKPNLSLKDIQLAFYITDFLSHWHLLPLAECWVHQITETLPKFLEHLSGVRHGHSFLWPSVNFILLIGAPSAQLQYHWIRKKSCPSFAGVNVAQHHCIHQAIPSKSWQMLPWVGLTVQHHGVLPVRCHARGETGPTFFLNREHCFPLCMQSDLLYSVKKLLGMVESTTWGNNWKKLGLWGADILHWKKVALLYVHRQTIGVSFHHYLFSWGPF